MKTHQEIHDAIKGAGTPLGTMDFRQDVLTILHALNDRILALYLEFSKYAMTSELRALEKRVDALGGDFSKLNKVVTGLCDIHP